MLLAVFTLVHVAISLIGIVSGFVVLRGLLSSRKLPKWTRVFLSSTILTSVTGFGFPVDRLLPSHVVGLVSLVLMGLALVAFYRRNLAGAWRWIYAATAVASLYLNVFVLVAQLFRRVPALNALAPTQSEPPFQIAQLAVVALFALFGAAAVARFRPATSPSARNFG